MIIENNLTYDEYCEIIDSVNWKKSSRRLIENSLENSMTVKYVIDNKTVGMARLVTDYGYVGLIVDVIVKPEYQKQGIGKKMINHLINRAKETLENDEQMLIQLLAADGKKRFYKKFGFKDKKEVVESGMYMWIKK